MAISVPERSVLGKQPMTLDIRKLAAAATLARKLRPGARSASPWRDHVVIVGRGEQGCVLIGGDPVEATHVEAPLDTDTASYDAIAVPYETIVAAAKGRKGSVTLYGYGMTVEDGAYYSWIAPEAATMLFPVEEAECDAAWTAQYDAATFRDAVSIVASHAGTDDSRPVLTGVYMNPASGEWAATDSYRLIVANVMPAVTDAEREQGAIIPASILKVIAGMKNADYFQVEYDALNGATRHGSHCIITCGGNTMPTRFRVRLIEGQYPAYNKLFPDAAFPAFSFSASAMLAMLAGAKQHQAIIVESDDAGSVSVELRDVRRGHDVHASQTFQSGVVPFRIALNAVFVRDALTSLPGDDVTLHVQENPERRAAIITSEQHDALIPARVCIMPVRA